MKGQERVVFIQVHVSKIFIFFVYILKKNYFKYFVPAMYTKKKKNIFCNYSSAHIFLNYHDMLKHLFICSFFYNLLLFVTRDVVVIGKWNFM